MGDREQASMALHLSPEDIGKTLVVQDIEVNSLEEVESQVKFAIWKGYVHESLMAIHVARSKSENSKYTVELVFETSREINPQELDNKSIQNQRLGFEGYKYARSEPLYQNYNNIVQVEVLETSVGVLALPVVIKWNRCNSLSPLKKLIQEALIQIRVAGTYTCKLMDIFILRGSKHLLEVGLMIERLERD